MTQEVPGCTGRRSIWSVFGRGLLVLFGMFVAFQVVLRLVRRYYHFPSPSFISVFLDSPMRRRFQRPADIVRRADIRSGMRVLEVGPGPGTFTIAASEAVGPSGEVVAIDIAPEMVGRLRAKLAGRHITNVNARLGNAMDLDLADDSFDRVFLVTVLAEISDRQRALGEFRRVLKPGGTLSVSEAILDPDYPRRSTVASWCLQAGFEPAGGFGNIVTYTLNFRKPSQP